MEDVGNQVASREVVGYGDGNFGQVMLHSPRDIEAEDEPGGVAFNPRLESPVDLLDPDAYGPPLDTYGGRREPSGIAGGRRIRRW